MTPEEQALALARWQGRIDGKLESQGEAIEDVKNAIDRVESKVNNLTNEQAKQQGGFRVGAIVGGFAASGVLLIFGAFVTKVFS